MTSPPGEPCTPCGRACSNLPSPVLVRRDDDGWLDGGQVTGDGDAVTTKSILFAGDARAVVGEFMGDLGLAGGRW